MKKKLFITAIMLAVFSFGLFSCTLAATNMDNAVNGVRNFVGGTENVVEDAGKGVVNGVRDGMNAIGDGARNVTNGMENTMDNNRDGRDMGTTGYTATRTSADTGAAGILGNTNLWTWMIIAIVGIIIVALVMYYAKQNNMTTYNPNHHDNDE